MIGIKAGSGVLPNHSSMTLDNLLRSYLVAVEVGPRYAESLRRTVRKAQANGLLEIRQLAPDTVNSFLAGLDLSPVTVGNIRRELLTLWRFAYEERLTEAQPTRIRRVKARSSPPVCWTRDELNRLWEAAGSDETPISSRVQLRRCDVLPAWIAIAYDSGMRFGDVLSLQSSQIVRGFVVTIAAKTGKQLVRQLSPVAVYEAARLVKMSPDGSLFLWCLPRRRALLLWRSFLDQHGFRGSSKWLRRAAATAVEMRERGAATAFLQHSSPHLAIRHYLDQTQLMAPVAPPPIADESACSRSHASCENPSSAQEGDGCSPQGNLRRASGQTAFAGQQASPWAGQPE